MHSITISNLKNEVTAKSDCFVIYTLF